MIQAIAADSELVAIHDIAKSFAGVKVLHGISFELMRGKALGLVGENGAGKSTLMNILGGVIEQDSGSMRFKGRPFSPANSHEARMAGIAFIQQELNIFMNLSIAENLFIDGFPGTGHGTISFATMHKGAREILAEVGLDRSPDTLASELAMGERQMVEISKALTRNADVFIFDEPTTSLSSREKDSLFSLIRNLKAGGKGVIYISHILEDVMELCEELCVLRDGVLVGRRAVTCCGMDELVQLMVGRELTQLYPRTQRNIGSVALAAEGFSDASQFHDISLSIREGEVLGLFGMMGAGRTELARALFGVDPTVQGSLKASGREVRPITPRNCMHHGMALVTENRRQEGLFLGRTVNENLFAASLDESKRHVLGLIDRRDCEIRCLESVAELGIKTFDGARQAVINLSGGNQQKVVIGKWLMKKPRILMLDEPTRGVDVGAKQEIYRIIDNLAANGAAILLISSELEEVMGISDRIITLCRGRITGEFQREEFNQEEIIKCSIGGLKR
jgi:ribose transport system ATP-binding protein